MQSSRAAGFSIVEVLVGMTIGLIGMIIMMQVFVAAEGNKRNTTGTDDAQNNGSVALYGLQTEMRHAGYGISAFNLLNCNVLLRAGITLTRLAPVTINHTSIPAGDLNTDTLLVVYGNSPSPPEGDLVVTQAAATTLTMTTVSSFAVGDRVLAEILTTPPCPATLTLDTVLTRVSPNITLTTGLAGMVNGTVFNLGPAPRVFAYAIRSGNLTVCDYMVNDCGLAGNASSATVWVPIGSNVVSLRAQYGRDTSVAPDAFVDTYDQSTPTTACLWSRVNAVRLVLVSRSSQYEKTAVTTTAPLWVGSATNAINLTLEPNWQNYRYRVLQTVIPLRNMVWAGAQSAC